MVENIVFVSDISHHCFHYTLIYVCGEEKQQEGQQGKHPKKESYRLSIGNLRNFYAKVTDFLFMMNILACNK